MSKVYYRGSRADAKRVVQALVASLTGSGGEFAGLAEGVFLSVGFAALGDIKQDYIRKARGGTGEDGVKWEPLKPETVARRRVGPGDVKSDPDIKRREQIRKREYRKLLPRYSLSLPENEARARAKQVAGMRATAETKKTKLATLGGRSVEILRDTGILLNSLSQGRLTSNGGKVSYSKPSQDGGEEQILEAISNGVIVGSNVPYAATHQYGDQSRGIPARPFLPDGDSIPPAWEERWANVGLEAVGIAARMAFGEN